MSGDLSMRDLLHRIRQQSSSVGGGGHFTPPNELKHALTEDVIREIISHNPKIREDQYSLFISLILKEAPIIFCTLLYDSNEAYIQEFLYLRVHDSGLPFSSPLPVKSLPLSVSTAFLDRQWEYLPIDLQRNALHRDLSRHAVLPFLEDSYLASGASGDIYKVKIHKECQHLAEGVEKVVIVARKQLRMRSYPNEESIILEQLRKLRHDNILELLSSYSYRDSYNLLFPFAEMNLYQFFRTNTALIATTILSEIYGLADALAQLHNFSLIENGIKLNRIGYHHDLRPANILVKDSKFLISDFGLSNLKPEDDTSKSKLRGGQEDYLSPESFNKITWTNEFVGRALDIWAFGCILTEFSVYMEGQSVEEYRDSREATYGTEFLSVTDSAFHLNGKVRPAVNDWLDRMVATTVRPDVAELVRLSRDMLNPVWRRRISISTVSHRMGDIVLMSKISAILDGFAKFNQKPKQCCCSQNIFVFLEAKRFLAWNGAFNSVDAEKTRAPVIKISEVLSVILTNLENYFISHAAVGHGEVDPKSTGCVKKICDSIDRLKNTLSSFANTEMDKLWIRNVAEIDDRRILLEIEKSGSPERYRAVGIKAVMKYVSRAVSGSISAGNTSMIRDQGSLDVDDGENEHDRHREDGFGRADRIAGDWDGHRVMIEWNNYDHHWMSTEGSLMSTRMEEIAKLLNRSKTPRIGNLSDRILNCLGYFHDFNNWRFGFVYAMPPNQNGVNKFYSLTTLIKSNTVDPRENHRPALGDIFKLTHNLASTLHALHENGWSHERVASENILIFAPSMEDALAEVSSGILTGFSQSRKEGSSVMLSPNNAFQLYQHPQYKTTNSDFRRVFDYYSLGIVLVELGLWVAIFDIWKNSDQGHREEVAPEQMKALLLKEYVPKLRGAMGTTYQRAVTFCIDSEMSLDFPVDEKERKEVVHTLFYENVVEPLGRCFA